MNPTPIRGFALKKIIGAFPIIFLLCFTSIGIIPRAAAQPDQQGHTAGVPWMGPVGVRERNSDIMAREARVAQKREKHYRLRVRIKPERVEYAEGDLPDSPPVGQSGPLPATSENAQGVAFSFLGATLFDCQAYPPDTMGAAGPTQFIVALNGRIRSFNKSTGVADGVINADTDVFFSSVMTPVSPNFTSDPRIRYDRLSGRWFIIMIDVPNGNGGTADRIMIAVSDGPIITSNSDWTFYYFKHDDPGSNDDDGKFADYPTLGIDAHALYIGVNIFGTRGQGSFDNTTAFVVRKSSLLVTNNAPTNIVVTAFRSLVPNGQGGGPYTPQGVDNYDPSATEGYIIGVANTPVFVLTDRFMLRRISDPGGTPSISGNVPVILPATYGFTIHVPHLGNTGGAAGNLDGLDYRLQAAHIRNGRLWTSHNQAVDNTGSTSGTDTRMGVRWYEIEGIATGQTPNVVQSGTVFQPSAGNTSDQRCYWMGTIMVSGQGHAAMGFSVAGASERANAGTAGRLKNDAAGTVRTPILYTTSTTAYNPRDVNNNPINRWGDYSYTCLDPNDDMTMWTIQQFCNANNSYGVQIAKLLAPSPATPSSCNPSSLAQGVTNVSVTLLGSSDGDTGFFDPGLGFSNRIAAAISGGGVTVNSIIYNNPTNLTLNVTVSGGAPGGARMVTVTNPDGQTATSTTGLLTVIGGNTAPAISSITNQSILEDTPTAAIAFTVGDVETPAGSLTLSANSSNTNLLQDTNIVFGGSNSNRTVVITPAPNQNGTTTITLTVADANGGTASNSFVLTVNPVNDTPSFVKGADQSVPEDSGNQTITGWATAISAGPPDESSQGLDFGVTNNSPALFSVQPFVTSNGTLSFTAVTNAHGTATVSLQLHDNGGTNNGGIDTSAAQTFTITVTPVNDAPVLTPIPDQTIYALSTLTITNTATDVDTPPNVLAFSLTNAPTGAIINPTNGFFIWTPADDQSPGTNTITVIVTDDGSPQLNDAKSFTITVVPRPLLTIARTNDNVTLTWTAIDGKTYRVQYKTNLDELAWNDLSGDVTAAGDTATKLDTIGPEVQRFYRIFLVP